MKNLRKIAGAIPPRAGDEVYLEGISRKSLREIAATTPAEEPLEASIVRACLKYLNSLEGARFQKRHGGRTRGGEPDISGCLSGRHWEIEVKRKGGSPTKRQFAALSKWDAAGAFVCCVTSLDELKIHVERMKAGLEGRWVGEG